MNKKTRPQGLTLSAKDLWAGTLGLEETYRAFAYLVWLTGARLNEISRMNTYDIYEKDGEAWYSITLSKLKKPETLSNPLLMFSDDLTETQMLNFVLSYRDKLPPNSPLFSWVVERERQQAWKVLGGEIHSGIVKVFYTPYNRIVRSKAWQVYARKDNGRLSDRKVTIHWLRNFVITNTLYKVPEDVLFAQQRIGHKSLATTMRYWTASRAEFLAKRARLLKR